MTIIRTNNVSSWPGQRQALTTSTSTTHRRIHINPNPDLTNRLLDRGPRHTRTTSHNPNPTPTKQPSLRTRQNTTLPLIQQRHHRREHLTQRNLGNLHPTKLPGNPQQTE